jgi:hypothetical protein
MPSETETTPDVPADAAGELDLTFGDAEHPDELVPAAGLGSVVGQPATGAALGSDDR